MQNQSKFKLFLFNPIKTYQLRAVVRIYNAIKTSGKVLSEAVFLFTLSADGSVVGFSIG